jgi:hypothetical protein
MEAKAYGRTKRTVTLKGRSAAPPDVVYDVLADLPSHMEWGGKRQYKMFRLLSLDAPTGPAQSGTVYTSTGKIPMISAAKWENTNTVTKASRPHVRLAEARARRGHLHQPLRDLGGRHGQPGRLPLGSTPVP